MADTKLLLVYLVLWNRISILKLTSLFSDFNAPTGGSVFQLILYIYQTQVVLPPSLLLTEIFLCSEIVDGIFQLPSAMLVHQKLCYLILLYHLLPTVSSHLFLLRHFGNKGWDLRMEERLKRRNKKVKFNESELSSVLSLSPKRIPS